MEKVKVDLPSGKIAYLKKELTAGDYDTVQSLYYENMDMTLSGSGGDQETKFKPTVIIAAKYRLLTVAIVEIVLPDQQVVKPVTEEYLRGMSYSDVNLLKAEADKIYAESKLDDEAKKK